MKFYKLSICCLFVLFIPSFLLAEENEEAKNLFSIGNDFLKKCEFQEALNAFKSAFEKAPENTEYKNMYLLLRQVIKIREKFQQNNDPQTLKSMSRPLRGFYYEYKLYNEALTIDKKLHSILNSPYSATLVAQTQILMGMNKEVIDLLNGINEKDTTPQINLLKGIALARTGKIDEAKKIAKDFINPDAESTGPGMLYYIACLHALVDDKKESLRNLTSCFETTLPSQLEAMKSKVKESKDLVSLIDTPDFLEVLKTQSKVQESKCSMGSGCGSCPSRGSCDKK